MGFNVFCVAEVAEWVTHWTHNPEVVGSNAAMGRSVTHIWFAGVRIRMM